MAENICLMVTTTPTEYYSSPFERALELAGAAVDLQKRTVLYLGSHWNQCGQVGGLKRMLGKKAVPEYEMKFRSFLHAGGQIWLSRSGLYSEPRIRGPINPDPDPLIEGAIVVDDKTLLTFLTQDTLVLTF